jgi:hypothetical protein
MKTKKTLKRLNKVVALLSSVIDKLPDSKSGLGDVLDSAKSMSFGLRRWYSPQR